MISKEKIDRVHALYLIEENPDIKSVLREWLCDRKIQSLT